MTLTIKLDLDSVTMVSIYVKGRLVHLSEHTDTHTHTHTHT